MDRLASIKSFFLLGNSDYLNIFIMQTEADIENVNKNLDLKRLNNLLQICISSSTLNSDPWREDYIIQPSERSLISELQMIKNKGEENMKSERGDMYLGDSVSLDVKMPFPLSILFDFEARRK